MSSTAEILRARERRWQLRQEMARRTGKVVVSCTLAIPGEDKTPFWSERVFEQLTEELVRELKRIGLACRRARDETTADGRFVLLSVDGDPKKIKAACIVVENAHPLGRLADFDVMCEDCVVVGRSDLGFPPRQCFVCSAPAAQCIRSKAHSLAEVQERIDTMTRSSVMQQGVIQVSPGPAHGSPGAGLLSRKQPSTRVEQAVVELERMIFAGKLQSGSHIKELDIATMLDISRGVVREAFISLAQTGLVEIFPHRGVFVRSFTIRETTDFFDLRAHLALMAMHEAAQNITPRIISELTSILDRLDVAIEMADPTEIMTLNWNFHQQIYDLCDNQVLKDLADDLRRKQFLSCRHSFRVATTGESSKSEHREVLKHLASGDGEKSGKAMHNHVMCGKRRFLEAISQED